MIIKISFREYEWLLKELETLRVDRRHLHEKIKNLSARIQYSTDVEWQKKSLEEIKMMENRLGELALKIKEDEDLEDKYIPGRAERRLQENAEIAKIGFSLPQHAVARYNERFLPYLTRDILLEILKRLGLAEKIKGEDHEIIKLKDNFYVAVEDYKVTTFKYDPAYYKQNAGNPSKVKLKLW